MNKIKYVYICLAILAAMVVYNIYQVKQLHPATDNNME